jgi:hypothetical protein
MRLMFDHVRAVRDRAVTCTSKSAKMFLKIRPSMNMGCASWAVHETVLKRSSNSFPYLIKQLKSWRLVMSAIPPAGFSGPGFPAAVI